MKNKLYINGLYYNYRIKNGYVYYYSGTGLNKLIWVVKRYAEGMDLKQGLKDFLNSLPF